MNQEFFEILGYEGLYKVNREGKIISLHRRNEGIEITKRIDRAGYHTLRLTKKGQTKTWFLHRLIARQFVPNPGNKDFVNHKDGDKMNNAIDNLEWVTHQENIAHAYRSGLIFGNCAGRHRNAVTVLDYRTGNIYPTIKEAARMRKFNYNTFRNQLNSKGILGLHKVC